MPWEIQKGKSVKVFFVNKRLAFGRAITSKAHVEKLRELGITHVINLRRTTNRKIGQFTHIWLPFAANGRPRPAWFYKRSLDFYEEAMGCKGAKLYVMCRHGICRSASLIYFFLRASGKGRKKAKKIILRARPHAQIPNCYKQSGEKFLRS